MRFFLFQLLLASIGISHFADSSPLQIPFQQLLDTCTNPEHSNSEQCQYFFSTYPWGNDDIPLVFENIRQLIFWAPRSSAWNSLEERLIRVIGNPYFDLASLGERSFRSAVNGNNEPLAIAIWLQMEKYKNNSTDFYFYSDEQRNHYSDLQLFECGGSMFSIIYGNMLQLLKKMVTDQPDCLLQNNRTMEYALAPGSNRTMKEFLVDHGLEIIPRHFQYWYLSPDGFEWALLNYRYSNDLIKNSIKNGSEVVAIAIWIFLRQKNYIDLLCQICNNTAFDVVKTKKVELLKTMLRDCPNSILSNGVTLMDISVNGGSSYLHMIQLLNLYGEEIPPNHLHIAQSFGYTGKIDRAILDYQLSIKRIEGTDNVLYDYFIEAAELNKMEIGNKILAQNITGIADIFLKED